MEESIVQRPTVTRLDTTSKARSAFRLLAVALLVLAGISTFVSPSQRASAQGEVDSPRRYGEMVRIDGGEFVPLYGSRSEPEKVAPFLMDIWPVTNGQFLRFVRENPRFQRGTVPAIFADENYLRHFRTPATLGPKSPTTAPVTNVSWFTARAYCASVGKRLPTVREWEYAARAGKDQPDATSDPNFTNQLLSWYSTPSRLPLPSVHGMSQNFWGLAGMHGVIWEWVEDFNSILLTGASRKDSGGLDSQLFCASGSIGSVDPSDYAAFMRYAMRASTQASYTGRSMGFRCAKDVPTKERKKP
jgi:formylglycine-generating enzyme required for sulfatase activity